LAALASYAESCEILSSRVGLFVPPERASHLDYCLRAASRDVGFTDQDGFLDALRDSLPTHPAWQRLLYHLAIGETYFFRDVDALRDRILPRLITRRRGDGSRTLRVWSAGCATGEEPFTVAILLCDLIEDIQSWKITILGTDINLQSLNFARRGLYTSWSVRSVLPENPYLRPRGNRWQLSDQIRRMVDFRYLNLIENHVALVNADLVLCRNVLFYIEQSRRSEIVARLNSALAGGGELLLDNTTAGGDFSARKPLNWTPARHTQPLRPIAVRCEDPVREARDAADRGQWREAHHWLDKALAQDRLNLSAHYLRALVFAGQGRTDDAIQSLRRCLYLDHNFALGYFTLGNLYAMRSDRVQALQHWVNAAELLEHQPPGQVLHLADGMTVSDVLALIRAQLEESHT
jgi:chemotaxis protein methyltransferase CheR